MGKRGAAGASGLGEAGATRSSGGEADKAELVSPSSTTGKGSQGRRDRRCRSREAECPPWGRSPRLRLSMTEGSRNRLNKTAQKDLTESILPRGTGGLDDLSRSLPTNPCFTGLCGSRSGTHACDLVTVLRLNGKVT